MLAGTPASISATAQPRIRRISGVVRARFMRDSAAARARPMQTKVKQELQHRFQAWFSHVQACLRGGSGV
eukprot:9122498-Pyramimonas_sp.AAC.1